MNSFSGDLFSFNSAVFNVMKMRTLKGSFFKVKQPEGVPMANSEQPVSDSTETSCHAATS